MIPCKAEPNAERLCFQFLLLLMMFVAVALNCFITTDDTNVFLDIDSCFLCKFLFCLLQLCLMPEDPVFNIYCQASQEAVNDGLNCKSNDSIVASYQVCTCTADIHKSLHTDCRWQ